MVIVRLRAGTRISTTHAFRVRARIRTEFELEFEPELESELLFRGKIGSELGECTRACQLKGQQ